MLKFCPKKYFLWSKLFEIGLTLVDTHVVLQSHSFEQLATKSTILQKSEYVFLLG